MAKKPPKPPASVPDAPQQVATVESLKNTPVTLGVVLLLGTLLASGIAAVFYSVQDLSKKVDALGANTEKDLALINQKLDYISRGAASAAPAPSGSR